MRFSIVGISHWKSGVSIRELFYLDSLRKQRLNQYSQRIPGGILTLDTCNRTEVYGFCEPEVLIKALCESTNTDPTFLEENGYIYTDQEAIRHLFHVGMGMDSQVLGDVQIIQQLKKAYKESSKINLSGDFHQLVQAVFKAHKRSRHETDFGKGNASVGYEATQQALDFFGELADINILLIGAGKMGKVSCKNLVANGARRISVVNRNVKRAENLACSYDIKAYTFEDLDAQIAAADLIVTATASSNPILLKQHLRDRKTRTLVIDLSVPRNVDLAVNDLPNVTLIDMDSITEANLCAMNKRKNTIPILEGIINQEIDEFRAKTMRSRYLMPRLKEVEHTIAAITEGELEKVKNKVDGEVYEQLELIANKIKKKLLAVHIHRIDNEYAKKKNPHEA